MREKQLLPETRIDILRETERRVCSSDGDQQSAKKEKKKNKLNFFKKSRFHFHSLNKESVIVNTITKTLGRFCIFCQGEDAEVGGR